ncbi:MAG TPA: Gfo/Idh/MocA family oxidoreductase [Planktothrix sp.]|jgi:predicted dehydrogenase
MTGHQRVDGHKPVRTALIGYGLAGSVFHAPLIGAVEGLELSAVVVNNAQRQDAARRDYPQTKLFASVDELFNNASSFDLVVVATPNDTHADLAEKAMQRGLAVVVDKPFAISTAQAKHLIEIQKKTGAKLSVFQNRRWDCDFLTVQELIDTGKVGTVTRLESRFERYRPVPKPGSWRETTAVETGGGLLFDLGSHLIDQAMHLFGKPISVYAEMKTRRTGVLADDDTFIALQFDNGICAHLWVSLLAKKPGPRFRLLGTAGAYEKYGMDPQEESLKNGLRPGDEQWGVEPAANAGTLSATLDHLEFDGKIASRRGSYEQYYVLMRDAVANGAPVPVQPEDALKALTVMEAARESATTREPIAV